MKDSELPQSTCRFFLYIYPLYLADKKKLKAKMLIFDQQMLSEKQ